MAQEYATRETTYTTRQQGSILSTHRRHFSGTNNTIGSTNHWDHFQHKASRKVLPQSVRRTRNRNLHSSEPSTRGIPKAFLTQYTYQPKHSRWIPNVHIFSVRKPLTKYKHHITWTIKKSSTVSGMFESTLIKYANMTNKSYIQSTEWRSINLF